VIYLTVFLIKITVKAIFYAVFITLSY